LRCGHSAILARACTDHLSGRGFGVVRSPARAMAPTRDAWWRGWWLGDLQGVEAITLACFMFDLAGDQQAPSIWAVSDGFGCWSLAALRNGQGEREGAAVRTAHPVRWLKAMETVRADACGGSRSGPRRNGGRAALGAIHHGVHALRLLGKRAMLISSPLPPYFPRSFGI